MNDSSCVFEVIYNAVTNGTSKLSVSRMCETAGVSRSGYYAWVSAAPIREKRGISLTQETILHSDQGCHYTSHKFIELLHNKELRQSMSRRGNCWDNAPRKLLWPYEGSYREQAERLYRIPSG